MGRTACTEPQCLYKGDLYFFTAEFCGKLEVQFHAFVNSVAGTAQIVRLHVAQAYATVELLVRYFLTAKLGESEYSYSRSGRFVRPEIIPVTL
jgi:hypothetical protein